MRQPSELGDLLSEQPRATEATLQLAIASGQAGAAVVGGERVGL
jgi:hypothetical protein